MLTDMQKAYLNRMRRIPEDGGLVWDTGCYPERNEDLRLPTYVRTIRL